MTDLSFRGVSLAPDPEIANAMSCTYVEIFEGSPPDEDPAYYSGEQAIVWHIKVVEYLLPAVSYEASATSEGVYEAVAGTPEEALAQLDLRMRTTPSTQPVEYPSAVPWSPRIIKNTREKFEKAVPSRFAEGALSLKQATEHWPQPEVGETNADWLAEATRRFEAANPGVKTPQRPKT